MLIHLLVAGNAFAMLLFGFALLFVKQKRQVHYWAIASFVAASINILVDNFYRFGLHHSYPHSLYMSYPLEYALGPFLFFFLNSLLDSNFRFRSYYWFFFFPPLVVAIVLIPYYSLDGNLKLIQYPLYNSDNDFLRPVYFLIDRSIELWDGLCLSFFVVRMRLLLRRGHLIKTGQVKFFLYYSFSWIAWLLIYAAAIIYAYKSVQDWLTLIASYMALIIFFYYFRHPEILDLIQDFVDSSRKSILGPLDVESILAKLKYQMDVNKTYLDETLTLNGLSQDLDITPHQLSEMLNLRLKVSFKKYINTYRLQYAQELLTKESHRSILDIAYSSGFRSKSAFNHSFKSINGITPSEYRNQKLNSVKLSGSV